MLKQLKKEPCSWAGRSARCNNGYVSGFFGSFYVSATTRINNDFLYYINNIHALNRMRDFDPYSPNVKLNPLPHHVVKENAQLVHFRVDSFPRSVGTWNYHKNHLRYDFFFVLQKVNLVRWTGPCWWFSCRSDSGRSALSSDAAAPCNWRNRWTLRRRISNGRIPSRIFWALVFSLLKVRLKCLIKFRISS